MRTSFGPHTFPDNLQAEIYRLKGEHDVSRAQQLEGSQSFVKEVRARLKELQNVCLILF